MSLVFIIIEPSYVVRKGLSIALEEIPNVKVIAELSDIDFQERNYPIHDVDFILINPSYFTKGREVKEFVDKHKAGVIALSMSQNHSFKAHFLETLNINRKKDSFRKQINGIISAYSSNESEEKVSNELSEREIDVLKCVAIGNTNKEIADNLFISTHTVISHRKNITRKLGIKTVSGLTVYAFINKYITVEEINK